MTATPPDLFPDGARREVVKVAVQRPGLRARLVTAENWTVEDHVSRCCLARVLRRLGPEGRVYMCSDCGREERGDSRTGSTIHPTICACGTRYGTRDAGVRCTPNPDPRPELPQAIIASQVG